MSEVGAWAFVAAIVVGPVVIFAGGARLLFGKPLWKLDRHENEMFAWALALLAALAYGCYRLVAWLI